MIPETQWKFAVGRQGRGNPAPSLPNNEPLPSQPEHCFGRWGRKWREFILGAPQPVLEGEVGGLEPPL